MERSDGGVTRLTARQRQVLDLVARGHTNAEIAGLLGISPDGAKWHVSELLGKFNASSREELTERWTEARNPARRISRLFGAVVGLMTLKGAAVTGVAGVVLVGAAGVSAVVIAAHGGGTEEVVVAADATASPTPPTLTPTPTATATALPRAAGWSAAEALSAASRFASAELERDGIAPRLAAPLTIDGFSGGTAEWLPQLARYEAPDGDWYWTSDDVDDLPHDAWHFAWSLDGAALVSHDNTPAVGRIEIEVLVEDGNLDEPLGTRISVKATDGAGFGSAHASNFHSHAQEEQQRLSSEPVKAPVRVAWLNNVEGNGWLSIYPVAAGGWCGQVFGQEGGALWGWCLVPLTPPDALIVGTLAGPDELTLTILAMDDVADVEVITGDLRARYATNAPPRDLGLPMRFVHVSIAPRPSSVTVVGYDANGIEVARETRELPVS